MTLLNNKFSLSRRESVYLIKKSMSANIYYAGQFENLNTTFPQTDTIVKGLSVSGVDTDEVQVILNMKNAWLYVLKNLDTEFNLNVLSKINNYVAYNESLDWGVLRYGNVGISGVKWKPPIPKEEKVLSDFENIFSNNALSDTYKAIHFMLYAMRYQLFWDGNKRTAMIGANMLLTQKGRGLISVTDEHFEEFNRRLSQFYETNDYSVIDEYVYENCLYGIDFE